MALEFRLALSCLFSLLSLCSIRMVLTSSNEGEKARGRPRRVSLSTAFPVRREPSWLSLLPFCPIHPVLGLSIAFLLKMKTWCVLLRRRTFRRDRLVQFPADFCSFSFNENSPNPRSTAFKFSMPYSSCLQTNPELAQAFEEIREIATKGPLPAPRGEFRVLPSSRSSSSLVVLSSPLVVGRVRAEGEGS